MRLTYTQTPVGAQHAAPAETRASPLCSALAPRGGGWNAYRFLRFFSRRINLKHTVDLVPRPPAHRRNGVYIPRISVRHIHFRRAGRLLQVSNRSMLRLRRGELCPYRH